MVFPLLWRERHLAIFCFSVVLRVWYRKFGSNGIFPFPLLFPFSSLSLESPLLPLALVLVPEVAFPFPERADEVCVRLIINTHLRVIVIILNIGFEDADPLVFRPFPFILLYFSDENFEVVDVLRGRRILIKAQIAKLIAAVFDDRRNLRRICVPLPQCFPCLVTAFDILFDLNLLNDVER